MTFIRIPVSKKSKQRSGQVVKQFSSTLAVLDVSGSTSEESGTFSILLSDVSVIGDVTEHDKIMSDRHKNKQTELAQI